MRKKYIFIVVGVVGVLFAAALSISSLSPHIEQRVASKVAGSEKQPSSGKGILQYFDQATGQVDHAEVEEMASRVPESLHGVALSRAEEKIQRAVEEAILSQAQADELRAVLRQELI